MVIDAHVHLYPPEVNADPAGWAKEQGEDHWAELATRVRKNGRPVQAFPTVRELLVALDDAGVDRAVLQGWYWNQAENCARQNAFYGECIRRHPDRLAAAVTVQPKAGEGPVKIELARARDAGFQGVGELSPHGQGYPIDDPNLALVLRTAAEWRWPVTLHVTAPDARPYPGMVPTPLADFATLTGRFPQTDFILAHFGGVAERFERFGSDPEVGTKALKASATNTYFDSAAGPLSYGQDIWQRFPAGRVLFGSDFPLNLYPALDDAPNLRRFVEAVRRESGLSTDLLSAVLGGTANRWFSVKAKI